MVMINNSQVQENTPTFVTSSQVRNDPMMPQSDQIETEINDISPTANPNDIHNDQFMAESDAVILLANETDSDRPDMIVSGNIVNACSDPQASDNMQLNLTESSEGLFIGARQVMVHGSVYIEESSPMIDSSTKVLGKDEGADLVRRVKIRGLDSAIKCAEDESAVRDLLADEMLENEAEEGVDANDTWIADNVEIETSLDLGKERAYSRGPRLGNGVSMQQESTPCSPITGMKNIIARLDEEEIEINKQREREEIIRQMEINSPGERDSRGDYRRGFFVRRSSRLEENVDPEWWSRSQSIGGGGDAGSLSNLGGEKTLQRSRVRGMGPYGDAIPFSHRRAESEPGHSSRSSAPSTKRYGYTSKPRQRRRTGLPVQRNKKKPDWKPVALVSRGQAGPRKCFQDARRQQRWNFRDGQVDDIGDGNVSDISSDTDLEQAFENQARGQGHLGGHFVDQSSRQAKKKGHNKVLDVSRAKLSRHIQATLPARHKANIHQRSDDILPTKSTAEMASGALASSMDKSELVQSRSASSSRRHKPNAKPYPAPIEQNLVGPRNPNIVGSPGMFPSVMHPYPPRSAVPQLMPGIDPREVPMHQGHIMSCCAAGGDFGMPPILPATYPGTMMQGLMRTPLYSTPFLPYTPQSSPMPFHPQFSTPPQPARSGFDQQRTGSLPDHYSHGPPQSVSSRSGQRLNRKGSIDYECSVPKYRCEKCYRPFLSWNSFRAHMRQEHNVIMCIICKKPCNSWDEYQSHFLSHNESEKLQCSRCLQHFPRRQEFENHMQGKCPIDAESP